MDLFQDQALEASVLENLKCQNYLAHTQTCIWLRPGGAPPLPPSSPGFSLYTSILNISITIYVSPSPPVERDILPSPAAQVQFIYHYIIGITIYGSPLPPVERDILPSPAALHRCGTGHPSFSCCPGSVYIQLYRHNDICLPPPPPPPVERDILPSPAALVSLYTII